MLDSRTQVNETVSELLAEVRKALGLEIGFISEFKDGRRFFRFVTADSGFQCPIEIDGSDPIEDSYCGRVADGRMPELMTDASQNAEALTLAATLALPVGAHLSVPIRFSDGSVFGTMCCFSYTPRPRLSERDVRILRMFAKFAAQILEPLETERRAQAVAQSEIQDILDAKRFSMVYQPILDIRGTPAVVGYEALARFTVEPIQSPDKWFRKALVAGLQTELELAAIERAVEEGLQGLPEDTYLSVNVSAVALFSVELHHMLDALPLDRLVLELTEHDSIQDYRAIASAVNPLRRRGMRLAVDDAGAGYASFRHILLLKPDIIKLDKSICHGLVSSDGHRALAAAIVRFAQETGSAVVAEGVETDNQLRTIRQLEVTHVQGFLLGRPAPLNSMV